MARQTCCHVLKSVEMPLYGVIFGQKNWIISPGDTPCACFAFQHHQGVDTFIYGGHSWLNVLAVCCDGVVKVGVELRDDLADTGQDWSIVLGTEHHTVHFLRSQFVSCDLVGEQRIAR